MASQLQAELRQKKPFESLEEEAMLSIKRTAAEIDYLGAELLKPWGITGTQYNALRILRGAGPDGLCRNEIRDRLIARVPDATRLLDRLEEMKLVTRVRGEDRRFVQTRITPAGLELLEELHDQVAALNKRHLGHLGPQRLRLLIELLADVRRKCR
jgi:DNA-binding MarR family transcriptional regulator